MDHTVRCIHLDVDAPRQSKLFKLLLYDQSVSHDVDHPVLRELQPNERATTTQITNETCSALVTCGPKGSRSIRLVVSFHYFLRKLTTKALS